MYNGWTSLHCIALHCMRRPCGGGGGVWMYVLHPFQIVDCFSFCLYLRSHLDIHCIYVHTSTYDCMNLEIKVDQYQLQFEMDEYVFVGCITFIALLS
jgi:hypothetical protein